MCHVHHGDVLRNYRTCHWRRSRCHEYVSIANRPSYNCTQSTSKINKGYVVLPQQLLGVLYYNVYLLAVGSVVQSFAACCRLCITILAGCCALCNTISMSCCRLSPVV